MEEIAENINYQIKSSILYKRYVFLKNEIENDEFLIKTKEKMENLKKEMCKTKNIECDEYYKLEKEYNSQPVVKEFLCCKDEIYDLLKDIADILSLN